MELEAGESPEEMRIIPQMVQGKLFHGANGRVRELCRRGMDVFRRT